MQRALDGLAGVQRVADQVGDLLHFGLGIFVAAQRQEIAPRRRRNQACGPQEGLKYAVRDLLVQP